MGIRSTHTTRNIDSRKASVPTIAKGKPLDARGSEGDLTFRRTSEGLKLYIKANHKWHGIKVGESFDSLEKKINEIKSKVDTIKQFRLPSTYSVTGDFTLDVSGDIELNADGGQVTIKDGAASHFLFDCDATMLRIYDDTDVADYFDITVAANGATTLSTVDGGSDAANLMLSPDGNIGLNSGVSDGLITFSSQATAYAYISEHHSMTELVMFEQGGAGSDSFTIQVAEHGATTLITNDGAAAAANLKLAIDGYIELEPSAGNYIHMDGSVGFTQLAETFSDDSLIGSGGTDDTHIDFRKTNKVYLAVGGDITNLNLIFPAVSGNFLLYLRYDGDHDIANYKVYEYDLSAAGSADVLWPGGTAPATTASSRDIFTFYWNATDTEAYGVASLNFS